MRERKRKDPTLYPLRTAVTECPCRRCGGLILAGDRYYDGGILRWFHADCAKEESKERRGG